MDCVRTLQKEKREATKATREKKAAREQGAKMGKLGPHFCAMTQYREKKSIQTVLLFFSEDSPLVFPLFLISTPYRKGGKEWGCLRGGKTRGELNDSLQSACDGKALWHMTI